MSPFLQGLAMQASLILALGAQNLFVLESGLRKRRHLTVASICWICDAVLILLGVLGFGSLFSRHRPLKIVIGALGSIFLFYYGYQKLTERTDIAAQKACLEDHSSIRSVIFQTIGFSLLNPHVYLDTLILIGGFSVNFSLLADRVGFGLGAATFSVIWFYSLALVSSSMSRWINNPRALRVIHLVSGIILIGLGALLGADVFRWFSDRPSFSSRWS